MQGIYHQFKTESAGNKMGRLIGTGTDPLGRYNEGEIFDVDTNNPVYADLIDNGWAKPVAHADDPGRTPAQLADSIVASGGELPEGARDRKAALDAGLDNERDAFAKVHTGDPGVVAEDLHTGADGQHGDLKRVDAPEAQRADRKQRDSGVLSEGPPDEQSGLLDTNPPTTDQGSEPDPGDKSTPATDGKSADGGNDDKGGKGAAKS